MAAEEQSSEEIDKADELPAEDGSGPPSSRRSDTKLLDRLLYKGVLPGYAFPRDVVSFHVFDEVKSEPFNTVYLYSPSQGLPVALSQYAPGKVVWIDNKEWVSGALYSPFRGELMSRWKERWLYFECKVCQFAKHVKYESAEKGDVQQCPACGEPDKFGPAMNWLKPPGFAHRIKVPPGTSPDDSPPPSYATRAKLSAEGPDEGSGSWIEIAPRIEQTYRRDTLLVTNTGPRGEGYDYCTSCGLIEPTYLGSSVVASPHRDPRPVEDKKQTCPGTFSTRGLVLGTDYVSDVLLIRLKADRPVTLRPQFLSTQVVLRTLADALAIEATERLELEKSEIEAEHRPALTAQGNAGLEAEIYLYDTLPGGAGFVRRISEIGIDFYRDTLTRLTNCPEACDESCYRCLRSFDNRFDHGLLNRHLGASFLRYLLDDESPALTEERVERAADILFADLVSMGVEGVDRDVVVEVEGLDTPVRAPIFVRRGSKQWIFGIHHPLTPNFTAVSDLAEAKEFGSTPVHLIDELVVSRNLPFASGLVLRWLL